LDGSPLTVSVVAVTSPELYRLLEPTPVVPTQNSKWVAVLPGFHVKATLDPVSGVKVFGAGVVSIAGDGEPDAT
jgi:hypothetical protein